MLKDVLLAPVDRLSFTGDDGWDKLLEAVKSHKETTRLLPITKFQDLLLEENGTLQKRYKFTRHALTKYCRQLVQGLSQAAVRIIDEKDSGLADMHALIDVINRFARARARRKLEGWRWIVDESQKKVLGLISARFKMTYSVDLLDNIHAYILQQNQLGFLDAVIHHRKLSLRFVGRKPAFTLPVRDRQDAFFSGFYFTNSEVGDGAIGASPLIWRQWSKAAAVHPQEDASRRLKHLKHKKFLQHLHELLTSTLLQPNQVKEFRLNLLAMREAKIGFPRDAGLQQKMIVKLSGLLQGAGLTRQYSRALIGVMVSQGSYSFEKRLPNEDISEVTTRRNYFDLWTAMITQARSLPPDERELAEGVAYRMMSGSFLFDRKRVGSKVKA